MVGNSLMMEYLAVFDLEAQKIGFGKFQSQILFEETMAPTPKSSFDLILALIALIFLMVLVYVSKVQKKEAETKKQMRAQRQSLIAIIE